MHIPENYISPSTCAVMTAAVVPAWGYAVKKVGKSVAKEKMPLLGIFAAFSFVAMMFNIPLPGGTTGHAVGGTLIAILLGPEAACISVSVTLILQAVLFGDGGVLAIGANCFNIAFVLPFVGYSVYTLLTRGKRRTSSRFRYAAAGIASYLGINAASLCTAIELGIQPYLFKGADGSALYCPYGLNVSVPAMMIGHLTIFGAAEAIFTVAVLAFVDKVSPQIGSDLNTSKKGNTAIGVLIAVLICATPLGLLATGDAWGEWGAEDLERMIGYIPRGLAQGPLSAFRVICPDYSIGNLPEWIAYVLSAVIGTAIVIILFKLISACMKPRIDYDND